MNSREAILALNLLPSFGPVRITRLLEAFGDAESVLSAPAKSLLRVDGIGPETVKLITSWQDHADPAKELAEAKQRGIAVANLPGTNSQAVSELTLLLMLACLRRLPAADAATRAGTGWQWKQDVIETAGEIHGRTVGLVGYGEVPRRLAPVLAAMGAKVIWCARVTVAPRITSSSMLCWMTPSFLGVRSVSIWRILVE